MFFRAIDKLRRLALTVNGKNLWIVAFRPFSRLPSGSQKRLTFAVIPVVFGAGLTAASTNLTENKKSTSAIREILAEADILYQQNDFLKLYDYLVAHREIQDDEVLWRLARATYDKAKMTADKEQKRKLTFDAFEYVKMALELNDLNFACHKWYAILADVTAEYEGTKQRISRSYEVKEHFMKAAELNPKDATTIYSLGYWCFTLADMPWYAHKVASIVFATPPKSSYEEALEYFMKAENADPNFYSMNLLMLGKTHLRLSNREQAIHFLTRAKNYPVNTEDDKQAHKEASELLQSLGAANY